MADANNLESEVKNNSYHVDVNRSKLLAYAFKNFFWNGFYVRRGLKHTTKMHVEVPAATKEIILAHKYDPGELSIMYAPLHKSFVETLFLPCVISEFIDGEIPYAIMNTKRTGDKIKRIMRKAGVYALDRTSRDAGVRAMNITQCVLESGGSFVYFPEGTRSIDGKVGKFGVAGFQAALNAAEKNAAQKMPVYIVPVDIVSQYIDDAISGKKDSYGFGEVLEAFKKNYGNTYISFGEPIRVMPIDKNGLTDTQIGAEYRTKREQLAQRTRDACIDLKIITNETIHAEAIRRLEASEETIFSFYDVLDSISSVVKDLEPDRHRFRDVDTSDIDSILTKSMLPTDPTQNNAHIFYSNLIAPFLPRNNSHI